MKTSLSGRFEAGVAGGSAGLAHLRVHGRQRQGPPPAGGGHVPHQRQVASREIPDLKLIGD